MAREGTKLQVDVRYLKSSDWSFAKVFIYT